MYNFLQKILKEYWNTIPKNNFLLEKELFRVCPLDLEKMDACEWYLFLRDKFIYWKYTDGRIRSNVLNNFEKTYLNNKKSLYEIKKDIANIDIYDIQKSIQSVMQIQGIGVAGATSFLSLLHPKCFGALDQFVVKSLKTIIINLAFTLLNFNKVKKRIKSINPKNLTLNDAVFLTKLLKAIANTLNKEFVIGCLKVIRLNKKECLIDGVASNQEELENSLCKLLCNYLIKNKIICKKLIFISGNSLKIPGWFTNACDGLGVIIKFKNTNTSYNKISIPKGDWTPRDIDMILWVLGHSKYAEQLKRLTNEYIKHEHIFNFTEQILSENILE